MQIQRFIDETGAAPIVLGHSLGGVLAAQLLLEHHVPASGLILSAPAFQIHMSLKNRLKLNLMRALAPDVVIELQYNPEFLTHDSEIQAQSKNDALIHGFKSARLVHWIEHTGNNAIALAHTLTVDALVLIAAADPVAKPSAARQWASNAPTRQITVQEYADSYHEIFNELPAIRDKATEDTLEWLDTLSGALQTNA